MVVLEQRLRPRGVPAAWRCGVPIGAAAIQLSSASPDVTAVVVGARDATEVIEDVNYLTAAVPAELFDELAAEHLIPIASAT